MSSVVSITVPATASNEFVHGLVDTIRKERTEVSSIQLDWSECQSIDSIALCLLLNLQNESVSHGLKIYHAPAEGSAFFLASINPILSFPISALDLNEIELATFLTAVNDQDKAVARVELMKKYLANHKTLKALDTSSLEIIFSELYMNVCQHSSPTSLENGIAMMAIDDMSRTLEFVISDVGIGIPANIQEIFEDFSLRPDEDAIEYATENWVTTKNTEQNYGQGLHTLKESVCSKNGVLEIFSGFGYYSVTATELEKRSLPYYNHGTQIRVCLDLRNFELRDTTSFSEEVTF